MLSFVLGIVVVIVFFGKMVILWVRVFCWFFFFGVIVWGLLLVMILSFVFEEVIVWSVCFGSFGWFVFWWEVWMMSV